MMARTVQERSQTRERVMGGLARRMVVDLGGVGGLDEKKNQSRPTVSRLRKGTIQARRFIEISGKCQKNNYCPK